MNYLSGLNVRTTWVLTSRTGQDLFDDSHAVSPDFPKLQSDPEISPRGLLLVGQRPADDLTTIGGAMADSTQVTHLSAEERSAQGKQARVSAPRSSHGESRPLDDRPDPVALLERQATSRVPDLVPIRYGRMLVSPFTFFRGAALIMAFDLAGHSPVGTKAQAAATLIFPTLESSPHLSGRMMFDVNDFDETLPGPWEWDLKRLAASVVHRRPGPGVQRERGQPPPPSPWDPSLPLPKCTGWLKPPPWMSGTPTSMSPVSSPDFKRRRFGPGPRPTSAWRADHQDAGQGPNSRTACRRSTNSPQWSKASSGLSATRPWWCRAKSCFPKK